jgi:hypothetical protein
MTRYVAHAGSDDHLLHTGPVSDRYQTEERRRATLTVAMHAHDAEDCRALLRMLGLLSED